jgi:hypothetical protein
VPGREPPTDALPDPAALNWFDGVELGRRRRGELDEVIARIDGVVRAVEERERTVHRVPVTELLQRNLDAGAGIESGDAADRADRQVGPRRCRSS